LYQRSRQGSVIYPAAADIFHALRYTPPGALKAVILGQDPYHGADQAMGLAFSVPPQQKIPPSLRNIFKEQNQDLALPIPENGDLTHLAKQGVLLLNSVMTVEADQAGSHGKLGWQVISDGLIDAINQLNPGCVFMLWGNWARGKAERIDAQRHLILCAAHPSPLSASRGFLGCRHFSVTNQWLSTHGLEAIAWSRQSQQTSLF
jgi:uracil-DNA glycosylase